MPLAPVFPAISGVCGILSTLTHGHGRRGPPRYGGPVGRYRGRKESPPHGPLTPHGMAGGPAVAILCRACLVPTLSGRGAVCGWCPAGRLGHGRVDGKVGGNGQGKTKRAKTVGAVRGRPRDLTSRAHVPALSLAGCVSLSGPPDLPEAQCPRL